ncbi:unnamed protein product [Adineta steineri]|uniref:Glycosyl hydrolase family 13 catalytic domain-containing protein n=1 Tax=Adineta steineri TaxID=433720 RepID=A0A819FCE0_9BILA|nr:unnamed protein product [Adineta steineri]CAF3865691.1 unnamed protein product [Adineta steineri]
MFSLFAPTIIDVRLIGSFSQWKEILMNRQDDGTFICSPNISDGQHEYKFRIKRKKEDDQWIDIIDPYVTKYDPEQNTGIMWVKEGKRLLNDAIDYKWKYDHTKMPENNNLIIYEIYVADFSDNEQFTGVIDRLDYLKDLGINAILLMPIVESLGLSHDWGYVPRNLFSLKSTFGTCTDLKNLVDQCHRRSIRILFDGVFNHTSGDCPLAIIDQDYWYYIGKHNPDDPYYWGPELNYEFYDKIRNIKPAVRYISDVVKYWIGEFHFDGLRFDAAKQMDNYDILYELDQVARNAARPGQPFTTQAEHMPETLNIIKANGGPTDTCWSLSFMNNIDEALADKFDLDKMKYIIGTPNLINYTACHDNKRLLARLNERLSGFDDEIFRRMKLAAIILTTSAGIPLIWQGDEIGEAISVDETDENKTKIKRPMHWNLLKNKRNRNLFNTFKYLFAFRHKTDNLRNGEIDFCYENTDDHVLVYRRGVNIIILCYFSNEKRLNYTIENISTKPNTIWIDILTNEYFIVNDRNTLVLTLNSYDGRILLQTNKHNFRFCLPVPCFHD